MENVIGIREKENKLFVKLKAVNPAIITDGIVDEAEYLTAKYKIAYILKEVNGGESWDLREFLYNGGRSQTWDNIARWTEAILNLEKDRYWAYWEQHNEERRKIYLKKICVVNLKKTSGGHTSDKHAILEAAKANQNFLRDQMALYSPDIIICCGTERAFYDCFYKESDAVWEMTSRGIWFIDNGKKVLISFAHPESRTKDCFLHFALVDAVREILQKREMK